MRNPNTVRRSISAITSKRPPRLLKKVSPDGNHASHMIGPARQTLQVFPADDIALDGAGDLRAELTQDLWLDAYLQFRASVDRSANPIHFTVAPFCRFLNCNGKPRVRKNRITMAMLLFRALENQ